MYNCIFFYTEGLKLVIIVLIKSRLGRHYEVDEWTKLWTYNCTVVRIWITLPEKHFIYIDRCMLGQWFFSHSMIFEINCIMVPFSGGLCWRVPAVQDFPVGHQAQGSLFFLAFRVNCKKRTPLLISQLFWDFSKNCVRLQPPANNCCYRCAWQGYTLISLSLQCLEVRHVCLFHSVQLWAIHTWFFLTTKNKLIWPF